MNSRLFITIAIAIFLILGTFVAIRFAKGYRFDLRQKKVTGTGLLLANSYPKGASVFINEKLTTATDDTLHLPPGEYLVKLVKDGFISWEKKLKLEEEIVTQVNARLFPGVPDLKAFTLSGAINPTPSPDGQKIVYAVASSSASLKNGLWVYELSERTLRIGASERQIARNTPQIDFAKTRQTWSPDSKQILVSQANGDNYLLSSDQMNNSLTLTDVTAKLPLILQDWQESIKTTEQKKLERLPPFMQKVATASAKQVSLSLDETKMLYTATASGEIPENLLKKELAGRNTQKEERQITPGKVYVYDLEEDKNFFITESPKKEEKAEKKIAAPSAKTFSDKEKKFNLEGTLAAINEAYYPNQEIQWFPDSRHLILTQNEKIAIVEYDSTNLSTIFAGNFKEKFAFPTPTGNGLIILTCLSPNPTSPANLYSLDLK